MLNPNHPSSSRRQFSRNASMRNHRGRILFSPHSHHSQRGHGGGGVNNIGNNSGGSGGNGINQWYKNVDPWSSHG